MNKTTMKKWVKALRSGKYKKATGLLKNVEYDDDTGKEKVKGFCCLGVACEIGLTSPGKGEDHRYFARYSFLPKTAQEKLAEMNDSNRYSFKRIADYIEKNYKEFTK